MKYTSHSCVEPRGKPIAAEGRRGRPLSDNTAPGPTGGAEAGTCKGGAPAQSAPSRALLGPRREEGKFVSLPLANDPGICRGKERSPPGVTGPEGDGDGEERHTETRL
ncbi:unnamed protein product [Arctogadus glacialis]